MSATILIVDDELSMREFLSILLEREGFLTEQAASAEAALDKIESASYDLVISDVNMPGLNGLSLLKRIKNVAPETAVLMITAFSTTEHAVEAMKHGAYDYIAKPFKVEEIKVLVKKALEKRNLEQENLRLKHEIQERYSFSGLIGKSKKMRCIYSLIEKVSTSTANILILGESGTGKELVAKAVHYNSPRRNKPFIAINCGAIPENLMEGEFFGHRKGSFTGAIADRAGIFEQADGGTLFLDEIGEIPLLLQAKLLRVLQEREVRRIGAADDRKIDVRIVTASNRDLEELTKEGLFREDLFYRLNVVQVSLPPLRDRPEDIPLLTRHFYEKFCGTAPGTEAVSGDAIKMLMAYPFPGNVRELENVVERALALGESSITVDSLPQQVVLYRENSTTAPVVEIPVTGMNLEEHLDAIEKRLILQALERCGGIKKRAAELLGLTFRSFRYRLAKFGMDDDT